MAITFSTRGFTKPEADPPSRAIGGPLQGQDEKPRACQAISPADIWYARFSGFRLLRKFFHLLAVHCHLGHEPIAQGRAHDPDVLDDEISSRGPPLELLAAANARELVLVTAQQEKATEFPAVRLEDNRLEALDLTFLLKTGIVLECFVEHLDGLSLTASYGSPETDEEPGICHDPPLCLPCGHHQAGGLPPNMMSRTSWRSDIWPRATVPSVSRHDAWRPDCAHRA